MMVKKGWVNMWRTLSSYHPFFNFLLVNASSFSCPPLHHFPLRMRYILHLYFLIRALGVYAAAGSYESCLYLNFNIFVKLYMHAFRSAARFVGLSASRVRSCSDIRASSRLLKHGLSM